jgi:DUF1009 family protein
MPGALGIIAGGGALPRVVAQSARAEGRTVFVVALAGSVTDPWVADFGHVFLSPGEPGRAIKALSGAGVKDLLLAGKLERPKFSDLKLDARGMMVLPRVIAAAAKGDDALLRTMVAIFEGEGFRVIGVQDAAPGLLAGPGPVGRLTPSAGHARDIAQGFAIVRALGALDVGQAAVVCDGLALSVEAAEGTDAMLARVSDLRAHLRGTPQARRGVVVKAPKPIQVRKTDLPVIGVETVNNAGAAGLAGIAVEAGGALILDRLAVAKAADALGLFVVGVPQ